MAVVLNCLGQLHEEELLQLHIPKIRLLVESLLPVVVNKRKGHIDKGLSQVGDCLEELKRLICDSFNRGFQVPEVVDLATDLRVVDLLLDLIE